MGRVFLSQRRFETKAELRVWKTYTSGCLLVTKNMSNFKLNIGLETFLAACYICLLCFKTHVACSAFKEVDEVFHVLKDFSELFKTCHILN